MPMLVILVFAWMLAGAWKGARDETKNQARKGVAALQAMTAKGAQTSEGGRRVATAARGVGHVLKFAAVAAMLLWAAGKAIGNAAIEGAREGRQQGRDDYVDRTDDPHPAADSPKFNPRRCPVCGADFVPGDRDAGQAPWVHPAGSSCPHSPDVAEIDPVLGCTRCARGVMRNGRCDYGCDDPKPGPDPETTKHACKGCGIRLRRRWVPDPVDASGPKVRLTVHEDTNRVECAPKPSPNGSGPNGSGGGSNGRPDPGKPRQGRRPLPTCAHIDGCGIELVRGAPGQARWVHPAGGVCKYSGENASPIPDPAGANAS